MTSYRLGSIVNLRQEMETIWKGTFQIIAPLLFFLKIVTDLKSRYNDGANTSVKLR